MNGVDDRGTRAPSHALRFVRALVMVGVGAGAGCASSIGTGPGDASTAATCNCPNNCSCYVPDASASLPTCTPTEVTERDGSCAVAGPLPPPEMAS